MGLLGLSDGSGWVCGSGGLSGFGGSSGSWGYCGPDESALLGVSGMSGVPIVAPSGFFFGNPFYRKVFLYGIISLMIRRNLIISKSLMT